MRSIFQLLWVATAGAAFLAQAPAIAQPVADPRTALVIGNAAYAQSPLANPVNDASDMAQALRGAGFNVILKTDADQRGMKDAVRTFGDALKRSGGVGLFFYAGHGAQLSGENYILPVGDAIRSEADLRNRGVTAAEVVDAMAAARNGLNIVVLDACRDNPVVSGPNATRGLSRVDSNASLFVSFSTSPGAVALDGVGRNSPYTKHLTQAIAASNLSIEETFKRTLKGVYQETKGQQTPWISSSFFGDFVFRPPASAMAANLQTAPRPLPTAIATPALGGIYRVQGKNPNGTTYRGMVALIRIGEQFRFNWWIGSQVFTGAGEFAGRMLVVQWGARHPVIYTFAGGSTLNGEWADGSATERLELYARAAEAPVAIREGRYRVAGRNQTGQQYAGSLVMSRQGDTYQLDWRVGSSSFRGTGTPQGNILSVDWGQATPVVYAVGADGTLKGLWSAGQGEETLVPDR
jgi:Caspase domain